MDLNILPGDALRHVVGYLLPRDVFNLSMSFPDDKRYRPLLIGSLHDNLSRVMRSGRARFKSFGPFAVIYRNDSLLAEGFNCFKVCLCMFDSEIH